MSQTETENLSHTETEEKLAQYIPQDSWLRDLLVNNIFSRLFIRRKFILHRLMGLCFLIQWVYALYLYNHNYQEFHDSVIVFSLPVTGVLQSLTAIYTFTFLPRKQKDPGYFGDLTILSYQFIQENIFYELLTLYGWVYFNSRFFPFLKKTFVFEFIWVFYPYYIRDFFPQTRIRDSYIDKGKTDKNRNFYFFATRITKIFYIWGKHYISFFLIMCDIWIF